MTTRLISVIVCTHNRADLLSDVIAQLRAQEYPTEAFEIIVVDNNSTDSTPYTVEQIAKEPGPTVRYVSERRNGISFVRNRGAEVARHPYLVYLDDDCSVESDWLKQLIHGFDLDDNIAAVGGRVILDWSQNKRPAWLGAALEPWLAANSSLGTQPRLLDTKTQIMEGNMAVKREAWQAAGGFLGMEQFGSRNMAAAEVLYLLHKLHQQNRKIAFIPQAVAWHCMGDYTRKRFFQRAYWQGVTDGLLDYLIYRRSWLYSIRQLFINAAAMVILFGCSCFFYLTLDQARSTFYLVRAIRRFSLLLSELRMAGDWQSIREWISNHPRPLEAGAIA